jgi:2-dehydro-3-deoxyphosphogluconate aldolase/(4S)-4-hydroxy-2-oxoglutarate aldolase
LKALKGPFPFLRLIPTGGVTLHTAPSFLDAGASALGVGTDLVNAKAIAEGKPEVVTNTARAYVKVVAKKRGAMVV